MVAKRFPVTACSNQRPTSGGAAGRAHAPFGVHLPLDRTAVTAIIYRLDVRVGRDGFHRMLTTLELVWLLAAVAKGDKAAFERLYQATSAKLYGVVLRILRRADLADEVVQEVYLKVWNVAGQFDPAVASPMTWMLAMARNRAIDVVRRKADISIEEEPAVLNAAANSPDPLAARQRNEELQRLLACMGQLEEERRRLVLLAYYSGWSREQLAAQFDKPVNTIKTWLRRALVDIRECLGT
jgi:RNA polymerase sigma-70 factor, ECF subfamily